MARRSNPDLEEIENSTDKMVNPLRNEKVAIHHIYKKSILFDGKDHVLSGGKAETSKDVFVLPQLANGTFVNGPSAVLSVLNNMTTLAGCIMNHGVLLGLMMRIWLSLANTKVCQR